VSKGLIYVCHNIHVIVLGSLVSVPVLSWVVLLLAVGRTFSTATSAKCYLYG
jgi:hypothetical protein